MGEAVTSSSVDLVQNPQSRTLKFQSLLPLPSSLKLSLENGPPLLDPGLQNIVNINISTAIPSRTATVIPSYHATNRTLSSSLSDEMSLLTPRLIELRANGTAEFPYRRLPQDLFCYRMFPIVRSYSSFSCSSVLFSSIW